MEKITKHLFYIFIISVIYSTSNSNNYIIELYNIPVAKVNMDRVSTIYNNKSCTKILFSAVSNKITNVLFPIDNYYNIIIDSSYNVLNFSKDTEQPSLVNNLSTEKVNGKLVYKNTNIEIHNGVFNIFTLLDYLAHQDFTNMLNKNFLLEREGSIYKAKVTQELDYIILYIDLIKSNRVVEYTDIFTWALFRDGAKRMIWIDQDKKRINKCKFIIDGHILEAVVQ